MKLIFTKKNIIIVILIFGLLLCFGYMLKMNQIGYSTDEWLTLFVVENKDPASLVEHYAIDRPIRGYFEKYMFIAFGVKMINYEILGLASRFLNTIIFLLILMILFPKQLLNNIIASILYIIYPGFLQQINALDYQAYFTSHLMMMASFLICLLPIYFQKRWLYFISIPVSMLLLLISIGLLDFMVGMDLFRYFLIYVAYQQYSATNTNIRKNFLLNSVPFAVTTAAFTLWRVLFFETGRVNNDTSQMLMSHSTVSGLLESANKLIQNVYRQIISAWYEPFSNNISYLKPDLVYNILLMCVVGGIALFLLYKLDRSENDLNRPNDHGYALSMVVGGLIAVIGSLIPIIFGARQISFYTPANRYTYPGMMGSVMLVAGILSLIKYKPRFILLYFFIVSSLLVHYGNSVKFAINHEFTRTTWWQLTWRAPDIMNKTTVTGILEHGSLNESHTIWGPINLIYYPNRRYVIVTAEVLSEDTKDWIINGAESYQVKRGNSFVNNFAQLLLFSRPADSCLHLIDGKSPEISEFDDYLIRETASYSSLDWIITDSDKDLVISPDIFGPEPEHNWCYYYQKAQLARQERDWERVSELGNLAINQNYAALDPIEWLVFLQGFAYTKDPSYPTALELVLEDDYVSSQACGVFQSYTEEMQDGLYEDQHDKLILDLCYQ